MESRLYTLGGGTCRHRGWVAFCTCQFPKPPRGVGFANVCWNCNCDNKCISSYPDISIIPMAHLIRIYTSVPPVWRRFCWNKRSKRSRIMFHSKRLRQQKRKQFFFYELHRDLTLSNVSCNVCRNSIGEPRPWNFAYCKSNVTHNSDTFYRFFTYLNW